MSIDINSLNYFQENLVQLNPMVNWTKSGASQSGDSITIQRGGYIEGTLIRPKEQDEEGNELPGQPILSTSKYIKIGLDVQQSNNTANRYKPNIAVYVKDYYQQGDDGFQKTITRQLSINDLNTSSPSPINGNPYHSRLLMTMLGKPLERLTIRIKNNQDTPITINWIGLFASNDIGLSQVSQMQKEALDQMSQEQGNYQYGFATYIEPRHHDPINPEIGRVWLILG